MASSFVEAITPYIDSDGLIGARPNPAKWSSGNELMETSIACMIETLLNGRDADIDFLKARQAAIAACQNRDGSFDKDPGRPDQITHDDLKSIAAVSRLCGMPFARLILEFGKRKHWMLTNTGHGYWDAYAKPWDRAFYKRAASEIPLWYESYSFYPAVWLDAFYGDPSSNRLTWLVSTAVKGLDPVLDLSFSVWRRRMTNRYGTVGGLLLEYYWGGDPGRIEAARAHPFTRFGRMLAF